MSSFGASCDNPHVGLNLNFDSDEPQPDKFEMKNVLSLKIFLNTQKLNALSSKHRVAFMNETEDFRKDDYIKEFFSEIIHDIKNGNHYFKGFIFFAVGTIPIILWLMYTRRSIKKFYNNNLEYLI